MAGSYPAYFGGLNRHLDGRLGVDRLRDQPFKPENRWLLASYHWICCSHYHRCRFNRERNVDIDAAAKLDSFEPEGEPCHTQMPPDQHCQPIWRPRGAALTRPPPWKHKANYYSTAILWPTHFHSLYLLPRVV